MRSQFIQYRRFLDRRGLASLTALARRIARVLAGFVSEERHLRAAIVAKFPAAICRRWDVVAVCRAGVAPKHFHQQHQGGETDHASPEAASCVGLAW